MEWDQVPAVRIMPLLGDFSVKTHTVKELWMIKWHKEWPEGTAHLPVWPPSGWMDDIPDPSLKWY